MDNREIVITSILFGGGATFLLWGGLGMTVAGCAASLACIGGLGGSYNSSEGVGSDYLQFRDPGKWRAYLWGLPVSFVLTGTGLYLFEVPGLL